MSSSSHPNPMRLLTDEDESGRRIYDEFHKNPYDLNSKIMLTAIISLSVVVLLVIVLHTYARCVLRRQALRRASMRHHLGSTMAHVHLAEQPKTGLEPSIIAALPTFVFTRVDGQDDGGANAIECAVCLSMLDHDEMARLLPNCKHSFHVECIDRWLNSHTTCPICRTEAQPRLQPEPREDPVAGEPTAPPLEPPLNSAFPSYMEGTSDGAAQSSSGTKANGSISRLSSFRKMLSRDRSSRRIQSCGQEDGIEDLERQ
ncbi:PREDICTED: RING-H2 [Prunus dulcis]|uniref:RING-type E3 ubiquitin transferase n=1 Tax=Prunus dulcis TaxID=3755 RepID=A0A5E4G9F0_PRUDU|nr:E3 ubiquitin-protein ligase ATL41-like [Prunus dulcis]VVA36407.1 PREDICTED: RING-H2 [Prunus dulcis]